jgi:PAS domain-containing protein
MDDKDFPSSSTMEQGETETIELNNLLANDLAPSGSFQLGRIPATTFGRLLEALPIPAFLIDLSYCVAFANEAFRKISADYEETEGRAFCSFFAEPSTPKKVQAMLEEVFSTRRSQVVEATLKIGSREICARISFRSLRMGNARLILVLVEDLTSERKQLLLREEHNAQLSQEVAQRKQAEEHVQHQNEFLKTPMPLTPNS